MYIYSVGMTYMYCYHTYTVLDILISALKTANLLSSYRSRINLRQSVHQGVDLAVD